MKPLLPWMKFLLRFVAVFNVLAGLTMIFGYHECYKIIGMNKPDISFPLQLVGILVALFGWGYYMVARHPLENRNVLLLGFWSKALGSCLGFYYVLSGQLPWRFVPVFFFADIIYLPPFAMILRRLKAVSDQQSALSQNAGAES